MSFEEFGLSPELLSGLADVRIEKPTPLQNEVIPPALQGRDMLVQHEAGDDAVLLIPALQRLISNGEVSGTRVLILTPSIERAKALDETVWAMGYHAQISSACLSMKGIRTVQQEAMKDGAPVVVANPGRLIEILDNNKLKLPDVDLVIIDEAHGMENYNLVNRVKDIMQLVEGKAQSIIFSESNNKATQQLSKALLDDPVVIGFDEAEVDTTAESDDSEKEKEEASSNEKAEQTEDSASEAEEQKEQEEFVLDQEEINRKLAEASVSVVLNPEEKEEDEGEDENEEEEETKDESGSDSDSDSGASSNGEEPKVPEDLTQAYIYVPPRAKISTLLAHLEDTLTDKIVVFAASKRTTDRLFRIIRKKGWGVVSINEGLKEEYYNERFGKFTSGDMKILLVGGLSATEVELNEVKQVINYDVPNEVEEYKYRAELVGNGKAARMVSLVSKMDKDDIDEIVKKVGYAPTEIPLPEEVKEKKSRGKKSNKDKDKNKDKKDKGSRNKKSSNKKEDQDRKRRKKPKEKENTNGLPRPSYDGLSGGKKGNKDGKRPTPSSTDGAFGWIKKLFD